MAAAATATATAPKAKRSAPATSSAAITPSAQAAAAASTKPAEPRVSLSEEEVAAAVRGELAAREERGSKNQESLTTMSASGRRSGRPIGITTGLPILGAWCFVFQMNEKAPARSFKRGDRPGDGKMTDEQVSEWMKSEFPGRETPAFDSPNSCRRDYNNGKFTKEQKPKVQSQRYGPDGQPLPAGASRAKKNEGAPAAGAPAAATATAPAAGSKKAKKAETVTA